MVGYFVRLITVVFNTFFGESLHTIRNNKIEKNIHDYVPLAYSPSQTEEAQKQILSRILQLKIAQNEIDRKSIKEFTD